MADVPANNGGELPENTQDAGSDQTPRATERFPVDRATERFDPERATARFEEITVSQDKQHPVRSLLSQGELIDDRYHVEAGPLGEMTGEAEVYRCTDTQTGDTVALKAYYDQVQPKEDVLLHLLSMRHPDVVTLRGYGTWSGRFFEVMDFCEGGCLADHMPYTETVLRPLLKEIVRGLQYLHNAGIIHRDIKPNNLFFRDAQRQDLVIGDFGVSSKLEVPGKIRRTSTATFFTLDYAAPELIDGKEIGPRTDYYALGVTLLHLIAGCSPFMGMDRNTILGCHFRGSIPRPEGLSADFLILINGLLRVEPSRRWGYRQVAAWLRHEPVFTDEGVPDRDEVSSGKQVPYRSLPEITTPREMARRLKDFDVCKDLRRGSVSQWLMLFDTELGKRVAGLEEEFFDNIELGAFKLKYILDPTQPLEIGDLTIATVPQLVEVLARQPDLPCRSEMEKTFMSGGIDVWVTALSNDAATWQLAERIAALRQRVKSAELGLFGLLYLLDPTQPLKLGSDKIRAPEEIPPLIERSPYLSTKISNYIFAGWFAEWLRAVFPDRKADIAFLDKCAQTYTRRDPDQAIFAFRCYFAPATPFKMGTAVARNPQELAAAIARSPQSMEEGVRLLSRGWIRTWLTCTGRMRDPSALDEVIADPASSWHRKMEAVLRLLHPEISGPVPLADAAELDGGQISTEDTGTLQLMVFNGGRGHMSGTITLETDSPGFVMADREIEGNSLELKIYISGRGLPPGSRQEARVVVHTNGGELVIPVWFEVSRPGWHVLGRCAAVGGVTAAVLGGFRLALQAIDPSHGFGLLPMPTWESLTPLGAKWAYVPAALLAVAGLGGVVYYIQQVRLIRKREANAVQETRNHEI